MSMTARCGLRLFRWVAAAGLATACTSPSHDDGTVAPVAGSVLADPTQPLPARLVDVGLYLDPADRTRVPTVAVAYEPRWPLWSGGSDKQRFVVLPTGETIDNRTRDQWRYPVGTLWFKTFSVGEQPIETRVLRKGTDEAWELATYQWNAEGDDAELLDGDYEVVVPLPDGGQHTIPSTLMCRECHESSPHPVLGDIELQLSEGIEGRPSALTVLADAGVLQQLPPPDPRRVSDHGGDEATDRVLGWFVGDCLHCHNGSDGPSSSFDLDPAVALANTVGQQTESSASAAGVRITAGDPTASILFLAVSGEHDDPEIEPMPPVAIDAIDGAAIEALRAFISGLGAP